MNGCFFIWTIVHMFILPYFHGMSRPEWKFWFLCVFFRFLISKYPFRGEPVRTILPLSRNPRMIRLIFLVRNPIRSLISVAVIFGIFSHMAKISSKSWESLSREHLLSPLAIFSSIWRQFHPVTWMQSMRRHLKRQRWRESFTLKRSDETPWF